MSSHRDRQANFLFSVLKEARSYQLRSDGRSVSRMLTDAAEHAHGALLFILSVQGLGAPGTVEMPSMQAEFALADVTSAAAAAVCAACSLAGASLDDGDEWLDPFLDSIKEQAAKANAESDDMGLAEPVASAIEAGSRIAGALGLFSDACESGLQPPVDEIENELTIAVALLLVTLVEAVEAVSATDR